MGPSGRRIITHANARTSTESQNVRRTQKSIHCRCPSPTCTIA